MDPLVSTLVVVSAADPRLNMSLAQRAKYAQTRDPKLIVDGPTGRATRYTLRPLTMNEVIFGCDVHETNARAKVATAFAFACERVEHTGPDGVMRLFAPVPKEPGATPWSTAELDELRAAVGLKRILEIGGVAYQRAYEGNAEGGTVQFSVPPLLSDELTANRAAYPAEPPAAT